MAASFRRRRASYTLGDVDHILSLRNVARDFYTRGRVVHAVADLSLDVSPGEFLTVVGPSGCGKSTLLNMIAGLLPSSAGEILYKSAPLRTVNAEIGYVTPADNLYPWLVAVMCFNALLNRLERYVLRWRPRERAGQARELQ